MFEQLFERQHALSRHISAPLADDDVAVELRVGGSVYRAHAAPSPSLAVTR
jgi:hypothetical protein